MPCFAWHPLRRAEKCRKVPKCVIFSVFGCSEGGGLVSRVLWFEGRETRYLTTDTRKHWNDTKTPNLTLFCQSNRCFNVSKTRYFGVFDSLPHATEPAGFIMNIHEINGHFHENTEIIRNVIIETPLWPPGDRKRSVLTSLTESGWNPPRTEMRERQHPNSSTIGHTEKS